MTQVEPQQLLFPIEKSPKSEKQKILCIALPTWPTDRARRHRADLRHRPLAIVSETGNRRTVVAMCEAAQASHVRVGMSLAEANVMCPGLAHSPHEPERDAIALTALARWMAMRFTPIVAVESPDALFLDIGGCERLFGGLDVIVRRVRESMRAFRIAATFAVASTPGAAWAFAKFSGPPLPRTGERLGKKTEAEDSLASLPPAALRITGEVGQTLAKLGIVTIRQLSGLPRDALPSRFGKELLQRLDQATGRVPEPLVAVECRTPIVVSREWDGPVESLEALEMVLDELVVEAIAQLARRGQGARRIEVTFRCPYAPQIRKTIALSRASREMKNLRRLLRCMLDALEATEGFNGIKLRMVVAEPIVAARQSSLVDIERESAEEEIEKLMERLKIRLDDAAFERAELVESYLPERAVKYSSTPTTVRPDRASTRVRKRLDALSDRTTLGLPGARPLKLLTLPLEIGVMVSPSGDREGFPIFFTHKSYVHHLETVVGPERVASLWWTGHNKTRDYFDVMDQDGKRFWIFRVIETWKWYLHGVF